jgi:hypothetical protein
VFGIVYRRNPLSGSLGAGLWKSSNFYLGSVTYGEWDSNQRSVDYEQPGSPLRARCLYGYRGAVPQMALIALFDPIARSTNRSTPDHGDHRMPATERQRGQGPDMPGLRQAGDVVDLDYRLFFIDRVEDAVPPDPQAPQIRRPVREGLRRPRLTGELASSVHGPVLPDTGVARLVGLGAVRQVSLRNVGPRMSKFRRVLGGARGRRASASQ